MAIASWLGAVRSGHHVAIVQVRTDANGGRLLTIAAVHFARQGAFGEIHFGLFALHVDLANRFIKTTAGHHRPIHPNLLVF